MQEIRTDIEPPAGMKRNKEKENKQDKEDHMDDLVSNRAYEVM